MLYNKAFYSMGSNLVRLINFTRIFDFITF